VADLYCRVLGPLKLRISAASTIEETVKALIQPFDLVWLRLPLLGFSANRFLEELLAAHDLAGRVGTESPVDVLDRLTSVSWYTKLSQQSLKQASSEEFLKAYHGPVGLAKQVRHKHDGQWLWVRMQTDEERAQVMQLLEQNTTHGNE
jgi:hypothetical protein